ncbi:MAG: EutN/CcmL family microcompartment protein [Actinomycetota bacterium]
MLLARVTGLVVATPKARELDGVRVAVLQPLGSNLSDRGRPAVAVDTVGAAEGQLVFTAAAGSARAASGMTGRPVDLAVIGIVDELSREGS